MMYIFVRQSCPLSSEMAEFKYMAVMDPTFYTSFRLLVLGVSFVEWVVLQLLYFPADHYHYPTAPNHGSYRKAYNERAV